MPISNDALNTQRKSFAPRGYPRKQYPFIDGQVIAQFVSIKEAEAKVFEDRKLPWEQARKEPVLRFTFIVLRADGKEEKGHGRPVSLQVRKPSYIGKAGPGKNASNAYKTLCRLLNAGKDLTDEQLAHLSELVNQLEDEQPQFYLLLEGNEETNWVSVEKIIKRVPDDEQLAKYVRPEPEVDARCANDDPSIVCSVTGQPIRGWEKQDGTWVDNREWAKMQREKLGAGPFTFADVEGEFVPPFIGRYYREAKSQVEAASEQKPF